MALVAGATGALHVDQGILGVSQATIKRIPAADPLVLVLASLAGRLVHR